MSRIVPYEGFPLSGNWGVHEGEIFPRERRIIVIALGAVCLCFF